MRNTISIKSYGRSDGCEDVFFTSLNGTKYLALSVPRRVCGYFVGAVMRLLIACDEPDDAEVQFILDWAMHIARMECDESKE